MAYSSEIAAQRLHALINSRPSSPSIDEMEAIIAEAQNETAEAALWPADKLETELRQTALSLFVIDAMDEDDEDAHTAAHGNAEDRLNALRDQLPARARTVSNLISRAEIAWFYATHNTDLTGLNDIESGDCYEQAAAELIKAVLEFAGLSKTYKLEG